MAHPNYKAIKNFLHNELGISRNLVMVIINSFINKEVEERVSTFLNSKEFERILNKRIDERINPVIKEIIKNKISWSSLDVTITTK